jgi:hypothetical protein
MCLCLQTLKGILRLQTRAYILVGTQFITCIIFINILILFLHFLILNWFICIRTPPPPYRKTRNSSGGKPIWYFGKWNSLRVKQGRWSHGAVTSVAQTVLRKSCVIPLALNWNRELFSSNLAQNWIWNSSQKRHQNFQRLYKKTSKRQQSVLNNWQDVMLFYNAF